MGMTAARVFLAKDFAKAVEYKEMVGGILVRTMNPNIGYVLYEVWHLPLSEDQEKMLLGYDLDTSNMTWKKKK